MADPWEPYLLHVKDILVDFEKEQANAATIIYLFIVDWKASFAPTKWKGNFVIVNNILCLLKIKFFLQGPMYQLVDLFAPPEMTLLTEVIEVMITAKNNFLFHVLKYNLSKNSKINIL